MLRRLSVFSGRVRVDDGTSRDAVLYFLLTLYARDHYVLREDVRPCERSGVLVTASDEECGSAIVLEDMDAYRDEGIGDVIVGEPFLREVRIKAKWFDGMITIYNGNDEVSEEDVKNGISHAYQKLKGFYKGVLNLGPDYIRNAKTEEWLIRGHISVHEME
ncbi:hypothetical protein Tco_1465119 [Tanacetum coccineum]